jgi:hypothetical protein
MNIYKNEQRIADLKTVKGYKEATEAFPAFFSPTNPKSVVIRFIDEERQTVRKKSGIDGREYTKTEPPLFDIIKCIEFAPNEEGSYDMWTLSSEPPIKDKNGNLVFKKCKLGVKDGLVLRPDKDRTTLVFLYALSKRIRNGLKGHVGARIEFVIPEIQAKSRIEGGKLRHQLEADILYDGIDHGFVKKMLGVFSIEISHDEAINRTSLFNEVFGNSASAQVYFNIKDGDASGGKMLDAKTVIESLVSKGAIVNQEGNWCAVGKTGVGRPFAPYNDVNPIESLAKLAISDQSVMDKLELTLKKSSEG